LTKETDGLVARLEGLIVQATEAARGGDGETATLLIREALATVKRLPQRHAASLATLLEAASIIAKRP